MSNIELEESERQLAELDSARAGLILKVNALRSSIVSGSTSRALPPVLGRPILDKPPSTNPEKIKELRSKQQRVILMSTGSLIGEGFDLPELDTLILTTPLSFEGRMIQYAGRLHRLSAEKTEVQIIDFVDSYVAMCLKMYRNRGKAYRKMGYQVAEHGHLFSERQTSIPFMGVMQ